MMMTVRKPLTTAYCLLPTAYLYLAVVLCVAIVFHQVLRHPTQMLYSPYSDILSQHQPFRHLMVEFFHQEGRLPRWNPTVFCGMPLLGDPQSGFFYPPNWIFLLSEADETGKNFGPLIILHLLIGGFGMLWWLGGHGFGPGARLIGALAFIFCGKWFQHVVVPGHVIFLPLMWLPWQCGLIDRLWTRPSFRTAGFLGLVTAMVICGCHPQLLFHSHLLLLGYTLFVGPFRKPEDWRGSLIGLFLAGLVGFLVSAIVWLPTLDLIDHVVRSTGPPYEWTAKRALSATQFLTILRPQPGHWEESAYLGSVAGVLALFGVLAAFGPAQPKRTAAVFFCLAAMGFSIWYALGEIGGLHRLLFDYVPGFRFLRIPLRIFLILGLPIGFLAAAGWTSLFVESPTWLRIPIFGRFSWSLRLRTLCGWLVVVLLLADQVRFTMPMVQTRPLEKILGKNPLVDRLRVPLGRQRVLALNYDRTGSFTSLPVTYSSPARIESLRGFNPLLPRSTFRYLRSGVGQEELKWSYGTILREFRIESRPHLDLLNVRWVVTNQPIEVEGLQLREIFDDLKVYHFSSKTDDICTMAKTYLYENLNCFPRAALIRKARLVDSDEEALRQIATLDPRQEVLVFDRALTKEYPGDFQPVTVEHHGDEISLSLAAGEGGFLLLSEMWYPGWRALDNGSPIPIHRGNGFFLLLHLSPGKHEVLLTYLPNSYNLAKYFSLFGLVLASVLLIQKERGGFQTRGDSK